MRAICTSASLQASTWVSPGFTLFRHSSPPFGSKQAHSNSTHGGPVGVGHFYVCTPRVRSHLPFSTREVLATISSPLRVCLTPWSVFQDGWRHPISDANIEHHGEDTQLARKGAARFISAHFTSTLILALSCSADFDPHEENAARLVLAD